MQIVLSTVCFGVCTFICDILFFFCICNCQINDAIFCIVVFCRFRTVFICVHTIVCVLGWLVLLRFGFECIFAGSSYFFYNGCTISVIVFFEQIIHFCTSSFLQVFSVRVSFSFLLPF